MNQGRDLYTPMPATNETFTVRVENYHNDETFDIHHWSIARAVALACSAVQESVDPDLWFPENFESNCAHCTVWTPEGRRLEDFQVVSDVDQDGRVIVTIY